MEATYSPRRQLMLNDTPSIAEVMEKYPILKSQKYVSIMQRTPLLQLLANAILYTIAST